MHLLNAYFTSIFCHCFWDSCVSTEIVLSTCRHMGCENKNLVQKKMTFSNLLNKLCMYLMRASLAKRSPHGTQNREGWKLLSPNLDTLTSRTQLSMWSLVQKVVGGCWSMCWHQLCSVTTWQVLYLWAEKYHNRFSCTIMLQPVLQWNGFHPN